jgi:hypothetical protein
MNVSLTPGEQELIRRKYLSEVRRKIDVGLKQLDEGKGIQTEEARAKLRRGRKIK